MKNILFYTKSNCHLCEEAYEIVLELINDIPMNIKFVDISQPHNQPLQEKYGLRIPVVAQPKHATELDWPFTSDDLRAYLSD